MLALIKSKALAIGAGIIAVLLAIVKFLSARNKSLKEQIKTVKSDLKFREKTDSIDAEIEQEFSHRAEEAKKDLESDEIPEHLANPSDN